MDIKKRRKGKSSDVQADPTKPTPFETDVCKYLYRKLTSSEGKLSGCRVSFFYAKDAVDALLTSEWAKPIVKNKDHSLVQFTDQDVVVRFMEKLIRKKQIVRAIKCKRKSLAKRKDDEKKSKSKKVTEKSSEKNDCSLVVEPSSDNTASTSSKSEVATSESFFSFFAPPKVKKSKKPQRLEYAQDQVFEYPPRIANESEDYAESVYVWIYEAPASLTTWILGAALIFFVIACCFFPIWPWWARQASYYATMAALGLLVILLLMALIRLAIFVALFFCTFGHCKLWLFPNFCADCGFFESFQPLYSLDRVSSQTDAKMTRPKEDS